MERKEKWYIKIGEIIDMLSGQIHTLLWEYTVYTTMVLLDILIKDEQFRVCYAYN